MGIIESDKSLPIRTVQGEGIVKTVRLFLSRGNEPHNKPDPMFGGGIDHQHVSV